MRSAASTQKSQQMLNGPITPTLWSMTWPMIAGVATLISFNLVDTFFISLLGTEALAAIGFTFPVTFTVISLTIGLGIGTSAVIARKLGANEDEEARNSGSSALWLSALLVGILAFLGFVFSRPIFAMLGATPEIMPLIDEYMNIWFLGAIFLVLPMVGNSILRASGDTKTPSLIMATGGLVNAILDPILIFGWGPVPAMGMEGAAYASVGSWLIGFVAIIYLLVWRKRLIEPLPPGFVDFWRASKQLLRIGLPAASANMLTPIAMGVLTAIVATHGAPAVAAFGAGARLESIASVVILALSMSLPPFISQNFGAGKIQRVQAAYKTALKLILLLQAGVYLLMLALLPVIQMAFARDAEVARVLALFVWIMPLGYGVQGWIILTNSSLNALHLPIQALLLSLLRLFVMFVPLSWLGNMIADLPGMFVGGVLANVITAFLAYRWFMRETNGQAGRITAANAVATATANEPKGEQHGA
ncbi:MATE family efflux transporter [Aliidiomarina iranensis]|uniref:MATE family efflux transporter n=1 Tax=Aliidiomarina iranensis TaxID=1434071 RepID=A0A432VSH2_9GAMM|nr:MATE family efflux transporter [Aliidiomarina iranensis]RUO19301.1 MATE family efflux transporter [Aliidiomarina iranensis]